MCHCLGYPPRVVAAWVTHSGSRCGASLTSVITHEVSCVRPEWHGCKTLGADRGSFTPARRCVSYVLRCLIPTSFAGAQRITLLSGFVRHWFMQHTLGANRGSSALQFFTARHNHCVWLTPSNPRPHTLVGKTPSQIGQTSLFVLPMWVQYPPPCMDDPSLFCRSPFTGHVSRLQCVRFSLSECVPFGCEDHRSWSCGWGTSGVPPRSWPARSFAPFTHVIFVLFVPPPHKGKTPSQIGQTSLCLASWSPFTNMGCVAPVTDVFASSLITWGMGVRPPHSPFVFSRLLSRSVPCSFSPRECPLGVPVLACHSHSRMLI